MFNEFKKYKPNFPDDGCTISIVRTSPSALAEFNVGLTGPNASVADDINELAYCIYVTEADAMLFLDQAFTGQDAAQMPVGSGASF